MNNDDIKIEAILRQYRPSSPPPQLQQQIFQSKQKYWNRSWLAVAAAVLLMTGIVLVLQLLPKPKTSRPNGFEQARIKQEINRVGQAAQLLALADLFANQPEGKNHAVEIYREIAQSYSDLSIAVQAQTRLKSY